MISSICRRRTSRETVAATDGSIFSITRSRSEAGMIAWWIAGSSRLGVEMGTFGVGDGARGADAATLGVGRGKLVADAGKPVANEGERAGASSSRLPNFFIADVL